MLQLYTFKYISIHTLITWYETSKAKTRLHDRLNRHKDRSKAFSKVCILITVTKFHYDFSISFLSFIQHFFTTFIFIHLIFGHSIHVYHPFHRFV
jgi:hypothetical protein